MTIGIFEDVLPAGWSSDVGNPPQLGDVIMSMQSNRSFPIPMLLEVTDPSGMLPPEESVYLPVRATSIRTVYPQGWDEPEYEVVGYVTRTRSEREITWVRIDLRTNGDTTIKEATAYLLGPGEEIGLDQTIRN